MDWFARRGKMHTRFWRSQTFFLLVAIASFTLTAFLISLITLINEVRKSQGTGAIDGSLVGNSNGDSFTDSSGRIKGYRRPVLAVKSPKATIAYAVSLTGCPSPESGTLHDEADNFAMGAAILRHSIHLSSVENSGSGSKYSYKLYAFVHPDASECSAAFTRLGYTVQIRDTPIKVSDIRGDFLREHVDKTGCCGAKEYIKLYSYLLFDHPVVVHLDLDSIVLQPFDELFDAMIDNDNLARNRLPVMFNSKAPERIDCFFTRDYNMANAGQEYAGVQGGFFAIRPSQDYFDEFIDIILEGNFTAGKGWDGKFGGYYGAQQIQGILSYFYDSRHEGTAVELNRCVYNNMADDPNDSSDRGSKCRDGRKTCEDCRDIDFSDIKSAHLTICGKPWDCSFGMHDVHNSWLCRRLMQRWFSVRSDFEAAYSLAGGGHLDARKTYFPEIFGGYCKGEGKMIPMNLYELKPL